MQFGEGADQAAMMMEPVGGMDKVVQGFMAKVGHLVRTHARVESVMLRGKKVEVVYNTPDGRDKIDADFSPQQHPVPAHGGNPKQLSRRVRVRARRRSSAATLFKIGLQMKERILGEGADLRRYLVDDAGRHSDLVPVPRHPSAEGRGARRVYLRWAMRPRASSGWRQRRDSKRRFSRARKFIRAAIRKNVETGVSVPWHRMNHMLGCASEWSPEARKQHFARSRRRSAVTT